MIEQETNWWKKSVVYEVYVRSFQDSNNDGIGDLQGVIRRLDYLNELGIDVIWLSPFYKSPNDDNGYDVSDYQAVMNEFGSMQDFEELVQQAKLRGIKIIIDLVLNHTSDEHPWFIEARKDKNNPYRDYYIWRDPVNGHEPNQLASDFGGSAWAYDEETQQYYLHLFSKKQPDLNWENEVVRAELYSMINFWIDKGVSGFRLDMIELIGKEPDKEIKANGPELHNYIKELNKRTFQGKNFLTVGEAWQANVENAKQYSNPDGSEFSMVFQFEHSKLDKEKGHQKWDFIPLEVKRLKEVFSKWQYELEDTGWNSLFWNNHDLPRIVSRWGDDGKFRVESAKMLATLLHGLKGTPYIYQGEEIGMTNVYWKSIEKYQDIETINLYHERQQAGYSEEEILRSLHAHSRDNARTPMQWDAKEYAGFSNTKPWIEVNENFKQINVENNLENPDSLFYHYQKLIKLRKEDSVIQQGSFSLLDSDNDVFAYLRKTKDAAILVINNFSAHENNYDYEALANYTHKELLLSNYFDSKISTSFKLRPYESLMIKLRP